MQNKWYHLHLSFAPFQQGWANFIIHLHDFYFFYRPLVIYYYNIDICLWFAFGWYYLFFLAHKTFFCSQFTNYFHVSSCFVSHTMAFTACLALVLEHGEFRGFQRLICLMLKAWGKVPALKSNRTMPPWLFPGCRSSCLAPLNWCVAPITTEQVSRSSGLFPHQSHCWRWKLGWLLG